MSTRCVVRFGHGFGTSATVAMVYRHSDGYPESEHGVLAGLARFFSDVKAETPDTRFRDPSYLAAKFVVWQARLCSKAPGTLDFLGVGVVMTEPGDIAYRYFVNCDSVGPEGPEVKWEPCEP